MRAGDFLQAMPDNWLQFLNICERSALAPPLKRSIPLWTAWLQWLQQRTTRVRKGSLLQLTARQIASNLLESAPLEVCSITSGLCYGPAAFGDGLPRQGRTGDPR